MSDKIKCSRAMIEAGLAVFFEMKDYKSSFWEYDDYDAHYEDTVRQIYRAMVKAK